MLGSAGPNGGKPDYAQPGPARDEHRPPNNQIAEFPMKRCFPRLIAGLVLAESLTPCLWAQAQVELLKLLPADGASVDFFSISLALEGQRALIGSDHDDDGGSASGSAYLFEATPDGAWSMVQKLTASDATPNAQFGHDVAFTPGRCLIGAWLANAAYIFERDGAGVWQQVARLAPPAGSADQSFGDGLALDGDRALISSIANSLGWVHVFERDASGNWLETALIADPSQSTSSGFGTWLSLRGERALISATGDSEGGLLAGAAYIFERDGQGAWGQVAKLKASDAHQFDFFGRGVLGPDRALVGAQGQNGVDFNTGAAYLFEPDSSGVWQQVSKLTASDAANGDYFGVSVDLDGDRALIGAFGVNDQGVDSGAAYAFRRDPNGNWLETGKLLPSGAADGDEWGFGAVALAGDLALISGYRNETLGSGSGAAALFDLEPLSAHPAQLSLAAGGSQALVLDAGYLHAGELVLLLGSASGTLPGIPLVPDFLLPLAYDAYLERTLVFPNQPPLSNSLATLNAAGRAQATFTLPAPALPSLLGLTLQHACVCLDVTGPALTFVSNPAALEFVP
jgi:hypothetical protein